jgi:hypothetical protein
MPKVSRATTSTTKDYGVAEDRFEELDGYTVNFVTIREAHDLAPMLAGLPRGMCPCPHWGYVFEGRLVVRYGDHEDVIEAGDAFYLAPGHTPAADAGTVFVQFSPTDELAATEAAIAEHMAAQDGAMSASSDASPEK